MQHSRFHLQPKRCGRTIVVLLVLLSSTWVQAAEFKVAVRAHSGVEKAMKKWGPTIDYLNQRLTGHRFVMVPYAKIEDQLRDGRAGKYDYLLTNPATYVELASVGFAKAIATLNNNRSGQAQARFGSVIFTHAASTDIRTLADLKGRTFMGVTPLGFGGWRVAWRELRSQGISPDRDFIRLKFGQSQPAVVKAVLNRQVDAGSVRTDMLERMAKNKEIDLRHFRVLNIQEEKGFPFFLSSKLYPEWPFAAMRHAPHDVTRQVADALFALSKASPAAREGKYFGWVAPLAYDEVERLLRELGVGPYARVKQ